MNRNDINRIFTEQVAGLLAQGYQIHTNSMNGNQGEIARVDLYKDNDLLRVFIVNEISYGEFDGDYIIIRIGKYVEPIRRYPIWNNELDILSEIKLVEIKCDYYLTPEEALEYLETVQEQPKRA